MGNQHKISFVVNIYVISIVVFQVNAQTAKSRRCYSSYFTHEEVTGEETLKSKASATHNITSKRYILNA